MRLKITSLSVLIFLINTQVFAHHDQRRQRVQFYGSVPETCTHGWYGRGIGVVAVCSLNGRYQVRFFDGRVMVCRQAGCNDLARQIDTYLRSQGR